MTRLKSRIGKQNTLETSYDSIECAYFTSIDWDFEGNELSTVGQLLVQYTSEISLNHKKSDSSYVVGEEREAIEGHRNFLAYIKKHGTANLLENDENISYWGKGEKPIRFNSAVKWARFLEKIARGELK